jgi:hypothetical protein
MKTRFPLLLTSLVALALAAPEAMAKDDGKDKGKDKKKDKVERTDHDRDGRDHDHDGDHHDASGKVTICHIPPGNAGARHTITVSESAWDAHQKHGDRRGACDHHQGDGDGRDRRLFEDLDRDHNDKLSLSEWPFGRESFDRLNRNHDDWITRDEYRRF